MRLKADAGQHGEILRVLDEEMAAARSPARAGERVRASKASPSTVTPARYAVYTTSASILTSIDFPTAGVHLDHSGLMLLRNVFALFSRDDKLGDLKAHLRKAAEADPSVPSRLALAAVLYWG